MGASNKSPRNGTTSHNLHHVQVTLIIIIGLSLSSLQVARGAKILFFIGLSSHSHRVAIQPLASKLSELGHEVTFLSPIKPEVVNPKIKEFCPQALLDLNEKFDKEHGGEAVISRLKDKYFNSFFIGVGQFVWGLSYDFHAATLQSPDFQGWVKNASFDLVITEHPTKEVAFGLAYKLGAKVIGFSASSLSVMDTDMFGWPSEASWLPEMTMGNRYKFIPDRFSYEFNIITWYLYYRYAYLPRIDSLLKDVFPETRIPPTEELVKNMKLYFVNIHFSSEFARSLPPFVVPVGGLHVQETSQPLPKTIEDFILTGGNDGFVYISFGSIIKLSVLPQAVRNDFFAAIAGFPNVRFLLKWEGEFPKDLPENVLPKKWFPQQDVLAHPKCRGFVTQGGLMSLQQAAYYGVPVIVVPVFGDQPYNAEAAVYQGTGIHLELADITQETFSHGIGQLLYNKAYSTKAKEVARRFRDRPMSPIDTAVWWTEYVLRHNDTSHMKPLGIRQEWWQRRLLDFWALVFTAITLVVFVLVWTLRSLILICKTYVSGTQEKVKKS